MFGTVLAILALCLRLALPGSAAPPIADTGLAAALGEHALCLATPAGDEKPTLPRGQTPGDHADHDGLGCCAWHATAGFTLPRIAALARDAFAETLVPRLETAAPAGLLRPIGPLQARAPPEAA